MTLTSQQASATRPTRCGIYIGRAPRSHLITPTAASHRRRCIARAVQGARQRSWALRAFEPRCSRRYAARDAHGSPHGVRSLGKRCPMPAASLAAAHVATCYRGPGPVSRLCYEQRRLGSTPRWVGLRAKRQPLVERCANRLQTLELAPCPCIALVPTACVPSTVAGFSLVVSFEYGDCLWCRRSARA